MRLILQDRLRFLAILCVLGACLSLPVTWVFAQSRLDGQVARDSARIDDLERRVDVFSSIPSDVAVLKTEMAEAGKLLWYVIGGGLAAIFGELAHRLMSARKKSASEDRLIERIVERLNQ